MLVGRVPFDDTSIHQILNKHLSEPPTPPNAVGAKIPAELEAVVLRCLEKEPDNRYQSAEELMSALDIVPDTAARDVALPIIAVTPETFWPSEPAEPTQARRETTMAGAAAAALPPLPSSPSATATVRAHEVRTAETKADASRFLLFGLVVVAVALIALFLLRGRSAPPPEPTKEAEPAAAAATAETPETPVIEPVIEEDPEVLAEPERPAAMSTSRAPEPEPVSAPPLAFSTATRSQPPPVQPESPPPLPEIPVTGVACEGVRDGCAALRFAIVKECRKQGVPVARPPRTARAPTKRKIVFMF